VTDRGQDTAVESVVVYESPITRERVEMTWPPTDLIESEKLRSALEIPPWVDLSDTMVRQGVVGLWAERRRLEALALSRAKAHGGRSASARLIGGVAFRILCPSANLDGGFRRPLKDVDYLVGRGDGQAFVDSLLELSAWAGSSYLHFLLAEDRQFNALRSGKRFRVRAVTPSAEGAPVEIRITDIFVGGLQFCHRLPVGNLGQPGLTVALPELLLTKLQFVKRVPHAAVGSAHAHRVMASLGRHDVAVGMEEKDILDVAAAFLDAEDVDGLSAALSGAVAAMADWGLWKTVCLNLSNTDAVHHVLESRGVAGRTGDAIVGRMAVASELMTHKEPRRHVWNRGSIWFDEVDDK
jgi:hypothetical protein